MIEDFLNSDHSNALEIDSFESLAEYKFNSWTSAQSLAITDGINRNANLNSFLGKISPALKFSEHINLDVTVGASVETNNLISANSTTSGLSTSIYPQLNFNQDVGLKAGVSNSWELKSLDRTVCTFAETDNLISANSTTSGLSTSIYPQLNFDQGVGLKAGVSNLWNLNILDRTACTFVETNNLISANSTTSGLSTSIYPQLNFDQGVGLKAGVSNSWELKSLDRTVCTFAETDNLKYPNWFNSAISPAMNPQLNLAQGIRLTTGVSNLSDLKILDRTACAFVETNNLISANSTTSGLSTSIYPQLNFDQGVGLKASVSNSWELKSLDRTVCTFAETDNLKYPNWFNSAISPAMNPQLNLAQGIRLTTGVSNLSDLNILDRTACTFVGINNSTSYNWPNLAMSSKINPSLNLDRGNILLTKFRDLSEHNNIASLIGTNYTSLDLVSEGFTGLANKIPFTNELKVGSRCSYELIPANSEPITSVSANLYNNKNPEWAIDQLPASISYGSELKKYKQRIETFLTTLSFKETDTRIGCDMEYNSKSGVTIHFHFHIYKNISGNNHIGNIIN